MDGGVMASGWKDEVVYTYFNQSNDGTVTCWSFGVCWSHIFA